MENAYWMRYPTYSDQGGYEHVAVIADTLDEAFEKLAKHLNMDQSNIMYRNRALNVLL